MDEIILENFPATLEWLKKTSGKYKFSGSYSRKHYFFDNEFCYRMWAVQDEETKERTLMVSCWIKPPTSRLEENQINPKEVSFEFTFDGLAQAKSFLQEEIRDNISKGNIK